MKIHIVQKGETLWEIAEQYDVDFEQLQEVNPHLSSPDMIMPGMKIMIPTSSKKVVQKTKKEDLTVKPLQIKEDDKKKKKEFQMSTPELQSMELPILTGNEEVEKQEHKIEKKASEYDQKEFIKKELYEEETKVENKAPYPSPYVMYQSYPQYQQPMMIPYYYCPCMQQHYQQPMYHPSIQQPTYGQSYRNPEPQYVGHLAGFYEFPEAKKATDQRSISDLPTFPPHFENYDKLSSPFPPHPMHENDERE